MSYEHKVQYIRTSNTFNEYSLIHYELTNGVESAVFTPNFGRFGISISLIRIIEHLN